MLKYIVNIPVQFINRIQSTASKISAYSKRPLRSDVLSYKGLLLALSVALAVFTFFSLTSLYELGNYKGANKTLLTALMALAALVVIALTDYALPLLFSRYFDKSSWTVNRQWALNTLRVFFVGLFVMVSSNQTGLAHFNLPEMLLKFTLAGSLFGFVLAVFKESNLRSRYATKAEEINSRISALKVADSKGLQVLVFKGSNDSITIVPNQLILLETDKYESKFSYQNLFGTVEKSLDILQESVTKEIKKYDQFCEPTKGVYVNKLAMNKVSADASGLSLHVSKKSGVIRVNSRFEKQLSEI